jgi:cytochrome c biogenesis protein CcmG, thiol:disulfide interchange protein DsbE
MARVKLIGQLAAVGLVVALFGLLVWKVARDDDPGGAAAKFQRGEPVDAPVFSLSRLEGEGKLRLESLRGKVVVINFWAAWCDPCKKEAPLFEAAWQRYRSKGVEFVGINTNDFTGAAKDFVERYEVTYPNVRDANGRVLAEYGGLPLPRTFVVGRTGRIVGYIYGEASAEDLERGIESALRA